MAKWDIHTNFLNRTENGPTMYMKQKQMDMQEDIKAALDNFNEFLEDYEELGGKYVILVKPEGSAPIGIEFEC